MESSFKPLPVETIVRALVTGLELFGFWTWRNILLARTPGHQIQEPAGLFLSFGQKTIPVYGTYAEKTVEERLKQLGLPVNTPVSVLAVELFNGEANVIPPNRFGPEATAPGAVAVQPDPLGENLGARRVLRVSLLTAVRAVC